MNLYFTYESHDTLTSFTLFITVRTITKLNPEHSDKFEITIKEVAGVDHVVQTLFHLTLMFCRGRQRNVPIITHVHSRGTVH